MKMNLIRIEDPNHFDDLVKDLRINLSDKSFRIETPPAALYENLIGGNSLASHYLRDTLTLP